MTYNLQDHPLYLAGLTACSNDLGTQVNLCDLCFNTKIGSVGRLIAAEAFDFIKCIFFGFKIEIRYISINIAQCCG